MRRVRTLFAGEWVMSGDFQSYYFLHRLVDDLMAVVLMSCMLSTQNKASSLFFIPRPRISEVFFGLMLELLFPVFCEPPPMRQTCTYPENKQYSKKSDASTFL